VPVPVLAFAEHDAAAEVEVIMDRAREMAQVYRSVARPRDRVLWIQDLSPRRHAVSARKSAAYDIAVDAASNRRTCSQQARSQAPSSEVKGRGETVMKSGMAAFRIPARRSVELEN